MNNYELKRNGYTVAKLITNGPTMAAIIVGLGATTNDVWDLTQTDVPAPCPHATRQAMPYGDYCGQCGKQVEKNSA